MHFEWNRLASHTAGFRLFVLAGLLWSNGLMAQDRGIFGFQIGVLKPMGDFKTPLGLKEEMTTASDGRATYCGGVFAAYVFDDHMIRGRIDYFKLPDHKAVGYVNASNWSYTTEIDDMRLSLDYLHFFNPKQLGIYAVAGFTYDLWKESIVSQGKVDGWLPATTRDTDSWNKLGVGLGLGYKFDARQSLELKYCNAKIGKPPLEGDANTLQLMYAVRIGH